MRIEEAWPDPHGDDHQMEILRILNRLWTYSITTKSDEARTFADEIAEAASRGFITTEVTPGGSVHGRLWKVTLKGMAYLYTYASLIKAEQELAYASRH